ncbi:glutamine--fructose-6-phosphate transaminase (isomerizing) [Candidatus Gracilibacteria bacterium]|nr:glutamine--fructose-6-phosphate transaminase (isomerizing) [Candidatus Gracilibacteria bacterium]
MCGIFGYKGVKKNAQNILLNGLRKLEYRGYDSAGIAVGNEKGDFSIVKAKGKISNLASEIENEKGDFNFGISHTRWATHGGVALENCHPHTDSKGKFTIVHNGIIENFSKLKKDLVEKGYKFYGETDTEVIAKLLEENFDGDLFITVEKVLPKLEGAFALLVMHKDFPGDIVGVKYGSPLVFGEQKGEFYFSSDIGALGGVIENVIYLEDGDLVFVKGDEFIIKSEGKLTQKPFEKIDIDLTVAEKGDFKHFMLKEIFEQPEILRRLYWGRIDWEENKLVANALQELEHLSIKKITFVACGTSYHAGLLGAYWLENFAGMDVKVEVASEFIFKNFNVSKDRLFIFISQSGETADTIEALKLVKERGGNTFGIVNVVGSTISRMTDTGMFLRAGTEVGVASTKAFTAQCGIIFLLALYFGKNKNSEKNLSHKEFLEKISDLKKIPNILEKILGDFEKIKNISKKIFKYQNFFFLGRHYQLPIAYESSLKLKEISYLHSEAYPAGELKHGPLALIDEDFISVIFAPNDSFLNQNISAMQEIKARKGKVLLISDSDEIEDFGADFTIKIPEISEDFYPFLTTIVGQLLSYEIADLLGKDIDKPRNLAKSVTVK